MYHSVKIIGNFLALAMLALPVGVSSIKETPSEIPSEIQIAQANCNYQDNLKEIANTFISKCCKASIRQEFPGEYYYETLSNIEILQLVNQRAKKAYKLLNNGRFRK